MNSFHNNSIQNLRSKQLLVLHANYKNHLKFTPPKQLSRSPSAVSYSDLKLEIFKESPISNMGPGYYNTPITRPGPSYSFSLASRIKIPENPTLHRAKSSNLIKKNKDVSIHRPANRKILLEKKVSQINLKRMIGKQTKKILEDSRMEKIKEKISSKFNRFEVLMRRSQKGQAFKTYSILILSYFLCQQLAKKLRKAKIYRHKIHKYLYGIAVICKALGKFKRSLIHIRTSNSLKVIKKHLGPRILKHCNNLISHHRDKILEVTENFFIFVSMSRINYIIHNQITLIQRTIRRFLQITKYRKQALRMLWNKLDNNPVKIPINAQNFYISSHLKVRIFKFLNYSLNFKAHVKSLITDKKITRSNSLLLNRIEKPALRIFHVKVVSELIEKAYRDKKNWKNIKFVRFSLPIGSQEDIKNIRQGLKRRNTMISVRK